jgi:Leucine-rich repeat (LRR) protein
LTWQNIFANEESGSDRFRFANVPSDGCEKESSLWDDFPSLPQLRCINLHYSGSDDCLTWLARCPNMEMVCLTDCGISDVGAASLARLKRLKILHISGHDLTADGFRLLGTLPELEELWVESPDAGDEAVMHLSRMRSLRRLTLYGLPITDEGLEQLAALPALEELGVVHTDVTDKGVKKIRMLLPNCRIDYRP